MNKCGFQMEDFTATHAGQGYITVQYWYGGEYAEAYVPFTITGVTILDDYDDDGDEDFDDFDDNFGTDTDPMIPPYRLVFANGEADYVRCTLYPANENAVYDWSLTGDGTANGTFDRQIDNTTAASRIQFTPTAAGTKNVHVIVTSGQETYTADATLVVLDVSLSPSTLSLDPEDVEELTATVTPNLSTIDGHVSWSLEGEGATLATDYLMPTSANLTATGLGEGTVTVEYSFGGKTVSDEMTYDVNGILISPRYLEISIGQEVSLTTEVAPTGGTSYEWSVVDAEDQPLNIGTFDPDNASATAGLSA